MNFGASTSRDTVIDRVGWLLEFENKKVTSLLCSQAVQCHERLKLFIALFGKRRWEFHFKKIKSDGEVIAFSDAIFWDENAETAKTAWSDPAAPLNKRLCCRRSNSSNRSRRSSPASTSSVARGMRHSMFKIRSHVGV
jgi:hypothetical protein